MTEVHPQSIFARGHEDGLIPPFEQGIGQSEAPITAKRLSSEASAAPPREDVSYQILNSPKLRIEYLRLMDDLVHDMVEQGTEVAVFLDKSARPVSWMLGALWSQLAPPHKPDGTPYKIPERKYVNIDREQWEPFVGRSETGVVDMSGVPASSIDDLRKVFALKASEIPESGSFDGQTMLSGKKVMIIDEVSVSGDTLKMAAGIFRKAFPDAAEIVPKLWMPGRVKADPASGTRYNSQVPVWYSKEIVTGRMVGNRDSYRTSRAESTRTRHGGLWLSTTFKKPDGTHMVDRRGVQLHREVQQVARDLQSHEMPYVPATSWGKDTIETVEQRIARLDGITQAEYVQLRRETGNNLAALQTRYLAYIAGKATVEHT